MFNKISILGARNVINEQKRGACFFICFLISCGNVGFNEVDEAEGADFNVKETAGQNALSAEKNRGNARFIVNN